MMEIKSFVFNPFQENTYLLYDETNECVIIDPGCYDRDEQQELKQFIDEKNLKPVALLNTHCHIDHVFGNHFVYHQYRLSPLIHENEIDILEAAPRICEMYGLTITPSPEGIAKLKDNAEFKFGTTTLKQIFAPGHSPGSICFYNEKQQVLIGGDVLFQMSIGRTDLPGGDHHTLLRSITEKLLILPDDTIVYSGHGPSTTIGYEKKYNPYIADQASYAG